MGMAEEVLPTMPKWVSAVASSLLLGMGWLLLAALGGCQGDVPWGYDVMGCTGE